jgi:hypothetical protein
MKTKVNLTQCPKQRFPGDRKFKDTENPMNSKGNGSKGNGK